MEDFQVNDCGDVLVACVFDRRNRMRTFFPTFAEICYNSLEFREILQHREIIQKTVAQARPSDAMIIVLCSYSHDAWSRKILRESGALKLLIDKLNSSSEFLRFYIASSLAPFSHDFRSLQFICASTNFLKFLLKNGGDFYEQNVHLPKMRECNVIRCIVENDTKHNFYDSTRPLKKGLFTICNISELLKTKKFPKQYKELVSKEITAYLMALFATFLYDSSSLQYLNNELLDQLINYSLCCHWNDEFVYNALLHTAKRHDAFEKLLKLQFHIRLIDVIKRSSNTSECLYCSRRRKRCVFLLNHFVSATSSDYFISLIKNHMKVNNCDSRINACIAAATLMRFGNLCKRSFIKCGVFDHLFSAFREILMGKGSYEFDSLEDEEHVKRIREKKPLDVALKKSDRNSRNRLSIVFQILTSFGIDRDHIAGNTAYVKTIFPIHCRQRVKQTKWMDAYYCEIYCYDKIARVGRKVIFKEKNGSLIGVVPANMLRNGSEYFNAMCNYVSGTGFSFDDHVFTFCAEEEHCSVEQFMQFIHFVCGCRTEKCFRLNDASSVAVMIRLADKYLCQALADLLFDNDGPCQRFICPSTLLDFFEVTSCTHLDTKNTLHNLIVTEVLSVNHFSKDSIFHFLKHIAETEGTLEIFIDMMRSFLNC
ncbi:unnamed protein product [Dracunculus medinensis]|uniref:BTB domain-containing protein n=1 Tax=Dracunculus medinensis TaxID=318479 RepID=A0A158Q5E1_DRAME|nr:unnamed protein product [Dracunculus medinensis]